MWPSLGESRSENAFFDIHSFFNTSESVLQNETPDRRNGNTHSVVCQCYSKYCRVHPTVPDLMSNIKYVFSGGKVIFKSNVINMNRSCTGKLPTRGFLNARLYLIEVSSCSPVWLSPLRHHLQITKSRYINIRHSFLSCFFQFFKLFMLKKKTDFRNGKPTNEITVLHEVHV